jgi:hypothetical protein
MSTLSESERLNLKRLINDSECEDNTEHIRKVKHSVLLRDDIRKLDTLKNVEASLKSSNFEQFKEKCVQEAPFLFNNYTDIFNKMVNDELDLTIMTKMLVILKLIEDAKVDQHEGSAMMGKILKELYVDSATKRMDNLDAKYEADKPIPMEGKKVSWKEFKKTRGETI